MKDQSADLLNVLWFCLAGGTFHVSLGAWGCEGMSVHAEVVMCSRSPSLEQGDTG